MQKIKYFVHYSNLHNRGKASLAAKEKIEYFVECLNELGFTVDIISLAHISSNEKNHDNHYQSEIKGNNLIYVRSFYATNKLTRAIRKIIENLSLIKYFCLHIRKNDIIIVYHSLNKIKLMSFLISRKKAHHIIEINEIYNHASINSKITLGTELNLLNRMGPYYLFANEGIKDFISNQSKYALFHGSYKWNNNQNYKFDDGKIHVVYAGIIDKVKRGAFNALSASQYLNERYHLHIIGFGKNEDVDDLKHKIVNSNTPASVTFDGTYYGSEYDDFLSRCHIGLATQNSDSVLNRSSFPSKVLSYLKNGLYVVSTGAKYFENSQVKDIITFTENDEPKNIAEAILKIDLSEFSYIKNRFDLLHKNFIHELSKLLRRD